MHVSLGISEKQGEPVSVPLWDSGTSSSFIFAAVMKYPNGSSLEKNGFIWPAVPSYSTS